MPQYLNGLEVVDSFNYLGFVLNSNGSARCGVDALISKAMKSMNNLFALSKT